MGKAVKAQAPERKHIKKHLKAYRPSFFNSILTLPQVGRGSSLSQSQSNALPDPQPDNAAHDVSLAGNASLTQNNHDAKDSQKKTPLLYRGGSLLVLRKAVRSI